MTTASHSDNDSGPRPFGEDEPATSGVLDIRALADAYESELERRRADTEDEPPMVSETGLGLLMPKPELESQTERPRFALWALGTLALVAATALATAFIVQRTMQPAHAAVPSAEQCAALAAAPAPAPALAGAPAAPQPAVIAAAPAALVAVTAPAEVEAVAEPVEARRAVAADDSEDDQAATEARRARREARQVERAPATEEVEAAEPSTGAKAEVAEAATAPVVEPPEPAPSAVPEPAPAEAAAKCDEVACLVDPSSACCANKRAQPKVAEQVEATKDLPERLSASDVNAGLRPRRGRIDSCGDRHGFKGTANLKLTITPAGKVGSVALEDGNSAFQGCVVGHVKKATFGESQQGMTLTYPIVFR